MFLEFELNGIQYRTDEEAKIVEAKDGDKWNITGSLKVILKARDVAMRHAQAND
jgi:hypothetical protein